MDLCPRVLCSHCPRIIEWLLLVIIFLFISRFGQGLSSLFHVYVLFIYLVFAVAISLFITFFYYVMLPFTLLCRHVRN